MKKFIGRSFIGVFFGGFLAVLFTNLYIFFNNLDMIDGNLFLKNSLGFIFCGWFFTVTPLYFENRRLSLSRQTILHFLTVIILYLILALSIGWIPFNLTSILLTLFIAIAVYVIFWFSFYLYFRNQARKLNDDLKRF